MPVNFLRIVNLKKVFFQVSTTEIRMRIDIDVDYFVMKLILKTLSLKVEIDLPNFVVSIDQIQEFWESETN